LLLEERGVTLAEAQLAAAALTVLPRGAKEAPTLAAGPRWSWTAAND